MSAVLGVERILARLLRGERLTACEGMALTLYLFDLRRAAGLPVETPPELQGAMGHGKRGPWLVRA